MLARCGRCGTTVEVMGAGRFQCPACGTTNQVPEAAAPPPVVPLDTPSETPEVPATRMECEACSFRFIVGDVETAICPNCREEVAVSSEASE